MEHRFKDREAASAAAAKVLASALARRLDAQKAASLVVSGGTTPGRTFQLLAQQELDWSRVRVLASDDRWVPADHEDSNEKLIRETLLTGNAGAAEFVSYFAAGISPAERCDSLNDEIRLLPFPFACSLLGMGSDGHFASLFPDADNLADGLDYDSQQMCLAVETEASPYSRISLTLSALSRSDQIALLFFGDDKWAVYKAARDGNKQFPVAHLLRQRRSPVNIYWAP